MQQCDSIITLNLTIDSFVVKVIKSNDISCDTPYAQLAVTKGKLYSWSPALFLNDPTIENPIATPPHQEVYFVTVTDSIGCKATDSVEITVNKNEVIKALPNVFTPNNDGLNDYLCLKNITSFKNVSCLVFNRWGNIVFQSSDTNDCWNGKDKDGVELSSGVYFFIIKGISLCDTEIIQNGTISLIR